MTLAARSPAARPPQGEDLARLLDRLGLDPRDQDLAPIPRVDLAGRWRRWRWHLVGHGWVLFAAPDPGGWRRLEAEAARLRFLADRLGVSIPKVLAEDPGIRVQVRSFVPGLLASSALGSLGVLADPHPSPGPPADLSPAALGFTRAMGTLLARLHAASPSDPAMALGRFPWATMLADSGCGDPEAIRALDLGPAWTEGSTDVLCHGDFHAENLLIDPDSGRVVGLLDFELMALAPRAWDLSFAARLRPAALASVLAAYREAGGLEVPLVDLEAGIAGRDRVKQRIQGPRPAAPAPPPSPPPKTGAPRPATLPRGPRSPTPRPGPASLALLLALGTLGGLAGFILGGSGLEPLGPADAVVVLGAAVRGPRPSPVLEGRLEHALDLFRRGLAPRIVLTGGRGPGNPASEAAVARDWLVARGVPRDRLLLDEVSRTTRQNLQEAARLLAPRPALDEAPSRPSVLLVSDPLHLARSRLLARRAGLDAIPAPTPHTRIRGAWVRLRFLVREVGLLALALVGQD